MSLVTKIVGNRVHFDNDDSRKVDINSMWMYENDNLKWEHRSWICGEDGRLELLFEGEYVS